MSCQHPGGCGNNCQYSREDLTLPPPNGLGIPLAGACPPPAAAAAGGGGCGHPVSQHSRQVPGGMTVGAAPSSPSKVTIPEKLLSCWTSLVAGRLVSHVIDDVEVPRAKWLSLPDGECWLGEPELGSRLFVRPCYIALGDLIIKGWTEEATWSLVLGTPGIGKSMFRCYVLWRICERHIRPAAGANANDPPSAPSSFRVILQTDSSCFLLEYHAPSALHPFGQAFAEQATKLLPAWKQFLLASTAAHPVYYIADGKVPDVSGLQPGEAHILEVSSPARARWKEFANGVAIAHVLQRYMPVVSLAELQHMRPHLSKYTETEVHERFRHLGGTVRNVLQSTKPALTIVKEALAYAGSLDAILATCVSDVGELGGRAAGTSLISSTLVHFHTNEEDASLAGPVEAVGMVDIGSAAAAASAASDDDERIGVDPLQLAAFVAQPAYSDYEPVFASNYIRHYIAEHYRSQFVGILAEMVQSSSDLVYTSVLQGKLFEDYVHHRLVSHRPNQCLLRSLQSRGTSTTVDLSGKPFVEFDNLSALTAATLVDGTYYKPISQSFGAIDFILGKSIVGNMTLDVRHGISIKSLLRVLTAMRLPAAGAAGPPTLDFYWIVPSQAHFQRMHEQPLLLDGLVVKDGHGKAELATLHKAVRFRQFVVLMQPEPPTGQKRKVLGKDDASDEEAEKALSEGSAAKTRRTGSRKK